MDIPSIIQGSTFVVFYTCIILVLNKIESCKQYTDEKQFPEHS